MDYNDFDYETKMYFKKAMDIYSSVKNIDLIRNVKKFDGFVEEHLFGDFDKKILSLFAAGFLVDGNLEKMLSQYPDLNRESVLSFMCINEAFIDSIEDKDYEKFFNQNFKSDLERLVNHKELWDFCKIKTITPEVVMMLITSSSLTDCHGKEFDNILDFYAREYKVEGHYLGFRYHPVFEMIENYTLESGSVSKKELSGYTVDMYNPNDPWSDPLDVPLFIPYVEDANVKANIYMKYLEDNPNLLSSEDSKIKKMR